MTWLAIPILLILQALLWFVMGFTVGTVKALRKNEEQEK